MDSLQLTSARYYQGIWVDNHGNILLHLLFFRLNSTEYGELREKLRAPISNAANVVIHQSLSDLFLETFTSLVEINQTYHVPSTQVSAIHVRL